MPKKQSQRRIDKTPGGSARIITVSGGSSTGGSTETHALAGTKHTGTLAERQAPWAVTDTEFSAHTGNINAHHNRQHSILSTSDHTLTASAYSILGATATNTIGLLHIASTGDGIDVTTGGGNFTIAVDVSDLVGDGLRDDGTNNFAVNPADFAGAGLGDDGSYNLYVKAGDGIAVVTDYVTVDEAYDFAWTGDHTHTGSLSSVPFDSADPITGWKIEADGDAWFANLEATSLTIKSFVSDVTLALAGSEIVTKSKAIISRDFTTPSVSGTLYVHDLPGQPNTAVFENGDYLRLRYVERSTGLVVGDVWGTVSGYTDLADTEQSWTFTRTNGTVAKTIYAGMVALDYGASGDGYVETTSLGDDAPYLTVRTWTSDPSNSGNHTTVARLGNLSGITDADYGALSGYGLFTEDVKAKGSLAAGAGDVWIDDSGVGILANATNIVSGSATSTTSVAWFTDPGDQSAAGEVGHLSGSRFEASSVVTNRLFGSVPAGATTGADTADIYWRAVHESNSAKAELWLDTLYETTSKARAQLTAINADGSDGDVVLGGNVITTGDTITPQTPSTGSVGTASSPFSELHVDSLFAGTTYSENSGHAHGSLYYSKAEITSLLAAKADALHSHAGYVTSVSLATTLADYATSADLATAIADFVTDSDLTTALNDYVTSVGLTVTLGSYVTSASLTTTLGDYVTSASLTTTLGDYVTSSGLTTTLGDYVTSADLTTTLGGYAASTHNILSAHTVTAAQYSVIGTPNGANTLDVWATTSDGSAGNKLLRTDGSGDLTLGDLTADAVKNSGTLTLAGQNIVIEDEAGNEYWNIASDGTITSLDPAYTSTAGVTLTPGGYLEVQDGKYRGSIATAVFEYQQQSAVSGQMTVSKGAGKLYSDLAIDTINNNPASYSVEVFLSDPQVGHVPIAAIGDILTIRAAMVRQAQDAGNSWLSEMLYPMLPWGVDPNAANDIGEIELEVTDISDYSTYYGYTCDWVQKPGAARQGTFPAGTAVVNLGQADVNGGISLVADNPLATYMDVWINKEPSYAAGIYDRRRPILRLGQIDTLTGNADEVGIMASADLSSTQSSYFILSDQQQRLQNVPIYINDGSSDTVVISSDGMAIETYVIDYDDFVSPYYLVKAIDNNLYGENEITWTSATSAPTVDNTYGRLFNVQFDLFEPYYDDDDELVSSGNEWWNYTVLEARQPDISGATANILRLRALADDGEDTLESWRWAGIEVRSDSDFSRITIDATGNHYVADGILELIGDITLSAGAQAGQEFVRILTPQLPESTDGVTIDGTQRRLRFGQWYVNPSTDAISFARG